LTVKDIASKSQIIIDEVERVIIGKRATVTKAVVTLLCGGHLLIEDIPGVGKTTLAKALSKSIGGNFRRIQFTPDLLPTDITGSSIFDQRQSIFSFLPGPIFGNVVLADEINRATPKTQSALLEAMEEGQVTLEGETRPLPNPFFVIATQNAVEMTGTYPLPEAQLDRFFARVSLGYPDHEQEVAILANQQVAHPLELVQQVVSLEQLLEMQTLVRDVFVHESVRGYVVDVVRATRESNQFLMGSSPRGSLHLMRAAQAYCVIRGGDFVKPDDVKAMAGAVLGHRVLARSESRSRGHSPEQIIDGLLEGVPTPLPVS
jgi:MoxR-like ATPase